MVSRRLLLCLLSLVAFSQQLHAQLRVELKFSRRLFLAYEPVLASISITNYSGRDILLENSEGHNWLNFDITNSQGNLLTARQGRTTFAPRQLGAGESCNFAVNLVSSYPISELGAYRVRASIYFAPMDKFFSSASKVVEVSEGKLIWEQTLGVSGGNSDRVVSLLTFRGAEQNDLYVRIEDKQAGVVYGTRKLGRMITQGPPQIEVDPENNLHVMQIIGSKTWLYSRIGINGEPIEQGTYYETKTRPRLGRMPDGRVGIAGGQAAAPVAQPVSDEGGKPKAKISDRPADFPRN